MKSNKTSEDLNFWGHLDELRKYLIHIAIVCIVFTTAAFIFKNQIFAIIFAPKNPDFLTYTWFEAIRSWLSITAKTVNASNIQLINTELANQFLVHIKASFAVGILFSSPYIIYLLFKFISPALYSNEKKNTAKFVVISYILFVTGVAVSYLIIFPFTFQFLSSYQVSEDVTNLISLESYMQTLFMISIMMGIMFEIPIFCWILAKLGVLQAKLMKQYRRHAIVIIFIVVAIITPTGDAFTLMLTALPMCLLYEISIGVVKKVESSNV
jgi:sec-independent protein translocase protein TatC